ncbi:hypothetical protein L195_g050928 [Trifolium pratense]|uniref:Uncharacterized protein n=1 Tax=Trifolium pratense TaxID=57577 RepID=A0A2K3JWS3_TRIPR|nr:hypothetical protein L195_g050928 [Trifolium pratense]
MKKLYRRKGTVHPSSDQLSFLPATILILTVALSPADKEILAYLISCSSSSFNGNSRRKIKDIVDGDHQPLFHCSCFHCYMSYWIRWNSSPNHKLIHKIIDDFEDFLSQTANKRKKKNKKGSHNRRRSSDSNRSELESVAESNSSSNIDSVEVENEEKVGSLRKLEIVRSRDFAALAMA